MVKKQQNRSLISLAKLLFQPSHTSRNCSVALFADG